MIMYRVVQQEPPSVRDLAPIVPRDLELICEKCLAKKPSERYQSASALADDLDRFLAGEPVSVVSPGPIERMGRWIRKHPTRAALYVFVLLTVMFAVFTGVAATLWFDAEHQRQLAENARDMAQLEERRANEEKAAALLATEEAQRQRSLAESARADADYVSAVRSVDLAFREYEFNNPAGAVNLLDGCPTRFRAWEWHAVDRLVSRQTRILRVPGKQLRSLALAPSCTHLAAAGDGMTVWNLDRGQPVASVPNNIRSVAFSRDGKFATVDSKGTIRIADSPTAAGQSFTAPHVGAIEFHPDGTQLISTNRNAVVLIDPVNRKVVKTIGWASGTVAAARFSPNGDRFAAVGLHESFEIQQTKVGEGTRQAIAVRIYDSRSGQVVAENLNLGSEGAHSLSWSSDGKQLAIGAWGRVILLNAASPNQTRTIPVGDRAIPAVAFNADDSLVIGADDKLARVWDSATGQQVDVLQGHSLPVHAVGFASDGTAYTAGDDGTVRFWQVATTPPEVTFSNAEDPPSRVAVSSDGRVLALGGNRSVEIRDTRSGAILKSLPVAAPARGLTFSADGGRIAVLLRDGSVRHWDWKTGGVQVLPSGPAQPAAATATFDYQKLVLHRDGNIAIVDRITGKTAGEFPNSSQDEPEAIALNREGSRLAAGSSSGTVRLWDARTGEELMRLPGHTTPVKGIAFNPDGTRLATVGSEGWLKVWDTRTGFEVLTLRTRQQPMVAVSWSPDGTKLVVVGGNLARILDATPLR
jgi:WD40 repeat protein